MKSLILTVALIATTQAFSMTKNVGDKATYDVQLLGMNAVTETEVTQLNRSTDEYNLKTTTTIQGQSEVENEIIPVEDLMTKEMANSIVANCSFMGGVVETIFLAGANRTTCKLEANSDSVLPLVTKAGFELSKASNGHIWIGSFPINGIGKLVTEEFSMTLKSMSW